MLRVDLRCAKPGMTLALPVRHPDQPSQVLLKMDYSLEDHAIARMSELGVRVVWVRCPNMSFLERFVSPAVALRQAQLVQEIAQTFDAAQHNACPRINYASYEQSIGGLVDELVSNPQSAIFLGDLMQHRDDGLMRHSSSVAYLSLLMGLKLEGFIVRQRKHIPPARAKELVSLGVGAMLHDIGVTRLGSAARQRHQETGHDDNDWQQHPYLGYVMVRGQTPPSAAAIVLHHHQCIDGTGYTGGPVRAMQGDRIHVFARIAHCADLLDELRFPAGGSPQPTVLALRTILDEHASQIDPQVLIAMLTVVPAYAPGTIVRLSDGRWSVCMDHRPANPCRPVVQIVRDINALHRDDAITGEIIDLAQCSDRLYVAEADDFDVSDCNFPAPPLMNNPYTAAALRE